MPIQKKVSEKKVFFCKKQKSESSVSYLDQKIFSKVKRNIYILTKSSKNKLFSNNGVLRKPPQAHFELHFHFRLRTIIENLCDSKQIL